MTADRARASRRRRRRPGVAGAPTPRRRPGLLALDLDGVLCDGRPEYFEASARAYGHVWSPLTLGRGGRLRERFFRLRPVIMSGWEMPVLLRAIVNGVSDRRVLGAWPAVRDRTLAAGRAERLALVGILRRALDDARRDWIAVDGAGWLGAHRPYAPLPRLAGLIAGADHAAVVTTKEGEFARRILAHWALAVDDVRGKEAGEHKCPILLELIARYPEATHGAWFVEDRLETLECVVRCSRREPRLAAVQLALAAWGYTTPRARAAARRHPRIQLLALTQFVRGVGAWPADTAWL